MFESKCFFNQLVYVLTKRKMIRLDGIFFEYYLELDDDAQSAHGCSSEERDSFPLDNIFLRRWQDGTKYVFICRIVGLCRSV